MEDLIIIQQQPINDDVVQTVTVRKFDVFLGKNPMRARLSVLLPVLLGLMLLGFAIPADAATGTVSPFITAFSNVVTTWYSTILHVSEEIFYALFGIDFVYLVAQWLIGGKDVHEIFTSFIKKLITIGFFYTILLNSQQLLQWVYQGFQGTGAEAGGAQSVSATSIFSTMMKVWTALLDGPHSAKSHGWLYDVTHIGTAALSDVLGIMLAGITALIVLMIVVYVVIEFFTIKMEALLVGSVGALMLGFAGSRWTVQYAEGFFRYAVSVGVRLLVLTLWLGFVENQLGSSVTTILNIASGNGTSTVGLFEGYGEVLIFFLLVGWLTKKLPGIANSVLTGASSMSGGEMIAAGVAAGVAAGAAIATGGAALAGAGGAGALTGAQAAAMDAGAAGSLGGAAGEGATAAGGGGMAGADAGTANAVPAPSAGGSGSESSGNAVPAPAPSATTPASGAGGNAVPAPAPATNGGASGSGSESSGNAVPAPAP
ncbi:P-type conjugative transfer protein TrbL, partial [Acidithiobacillus sp. BN09-2]|nr:P-type conjugative transfer protein TrbL [Acidithiobacillus sp. BN09-2]